MTKIYSLECAGIEAWDVKHPSGAFAGMIVRKPDGTYRHRYNGTGSKGSARKFPSLNVALENIDKRMARIKERRGA